MLQGRTLLDTRCGIIQKMINLNLKMITLIVRLF